MTVAIRVLGPHDAKFLDKVADDVFDRPIDKRWAREFLTDNRHHIAVALDGDIVVGFASAVHYVHPDKGPELWINEVGVAPAYQGRGIGQRVMAAILDHACALGCGEAWVGTEETNTAARRLYSRSGGVEDTDRFITYTFDLRHGDRTQSAARSPAGPSPSDVAERTLSGPAGAAPRLLEPPPRPPDHPAEHGDQP